MRIDRVVTTGETAMPYRVPFAVLALAVGAAAQCPTAATWTDFAGFAPVPLSSIPATNPYSAGPVGAGGQPGAAYDVAQSVIGGVVGAEIFLAHLPSTALPLPPTGLGAVSLSLDGDMMTQTPFGAFGSVVASMFCVEQGGVVYWAPSTYTLWFLSSSWSTMSSSGLTAASFVDGLGAHPDFAAGGPVRFGFTTGNGNSNGGSFGAAGMGTTTSRFDNFVVAYAVAAAAIPGVPGCGAGTPPALVATPPVLGAVANVSIAGAPAGAAGGLFFGAPSVPVDLGGGCLLGLDLATLTLFEAFVAGPGGGAAWSFPVPNLCALSGFAFGMQAVVFDPAAPSGFALTNSVVVVAGA
jgi:hypothetical protein